jgi:hypothetical protein
MWYISHEPFQNSLLIIQQHSLNIYGPVLLCFNEDRKWLLGAYTFFVSYIDPYRTRTLNSYLS